jgi:hypothetical protein
MDPLFVCPPPTTLASIPPNDCGENFGQIVKFAIQRRQSTPSFSSTTIKVAATWTPLLTATDSTKMIITPYIPGVVIPPGEILKEGGNDNTTIFGIPRLVGLGFIPVTAQPQSLQATVRAALQALGSESAIQPGFTNLWVYFFNQFNQIIANADGSGFDMYNFMVGDSGTEGLGKLNTVNLGFDLAAGWSKTAAIYNPTAPFKPLNM